MNQSELILKKLANKFIEKKDYAGFIALDNNQVIDYLNDNCVFVQAIRGQETWSQGDGSYITRDEDLYWSGSDVDLFLEAKQIHVDDYMSNIGRYYFDSLEQAHRIAKIEYLSDNNIGDLKSMGYSTIKINQDKYFYRIQFYSESFNDWDNMTNINHQDETEAANQAVDYFNKVDLFVNIDEEDMLTNRNFDQEDIEVLNV